MTRPAKRETPAHLEGRSADFVLANPLVELFARYVPMGAKMGRRDMLLPAYVSGRMAVRLDEEGTVLVVGAQEDELHALSAFRWKEVVLTTSPEGRGSLCFVSDGFGPQGLDLRVFVPIDAGRAARIAAEAPRRAVLRAAKVVGGEFRVSTKKDRREAPFKSVVLPAAA